MSTVSLEQTTSTPALDQMLGAIEREPKDLEPLSEVDINDAHAKGIDLAEHFVEFVNGEDNGRGFSAYFMREHPHHIFQEEGFLHEIGEQYPEMTTVLCSDKPNSKDLIFEGLDVFLRQETFIHKESGEAFGVRYVAHRLETPVYVGRVAARQIME